MSDQDNAKPERVNTTLSDAAVHWGDPDLVAAFEHARNDGTSFAYIFGTDSIADRLADPYCRALDGLRGSLIAKLKAEELVAYAFDSRNPTEADRTRIHPELWRVLAPDFDSNKAQGAGLELYDVLVTTPDATMPVLDAVVASSEVECATAPPLIVLYDSLLSVQCQSFEIKLGNRSYQLLRLLASRVVERRPIIPFQTIRAQVYSKETPDSTARNLISDLCHELQPFGKLLPCGNPIIKNRNRVGYYLDLAADQVAVKDVVDALKTRHHRWILSLRKLPHAASPHYGSPSDQLDQSHPRNRKRKLSRSSMHRAGSGRFRSDDI